MSKPDGRSLSEESLEVLRRQAHRLRCAGRTWSEIALTVGVHLSPVMSWSQHFDIGSAAMTEVQGHRMKPLPRTAAEAWSDWRFEGAGEQDDGAWARGREAGLSASLRRAARPAIAGLPAPAR